MEQILTAGIAAGTAVVVALITHYLAVRGDESRRNAEEKRSVQLTYLNPLRLAAVENYFRLKEIASRVERRGNCVELLYIDEPKAVRAQPSEWFNDVGAYLTSSCYLAACFFAAAGRVRRDLPFLRLNEAGDAELLGRLRRVSLGYLRNFGVFFVTQDSIGVSIEHEGRLLTYREFCLKLSSNEGVWLDRLLLYYIQTGQGEHPERVDEVLTSLEELMAFIESVIGGGSALQSVLRAETATA